MTATPRDRRPVHRWRFVRLAALVPAIVYAVLVSMPVAHACPPLDPLCLTDSLNQSRDTGPGLPDPGDVPGMVDDTVEQVQDTVGGAVDDVGKTVDEIINPGDDGDGGDGGDGGGGGGDPGTRKNPVSPIGGIGGPEAAPGAGLLQPLPATNVVDSAPVSATKPPGFLRRFGEGAIQAVKQLGFPLVLSLIVVAFLLIQNRLDRKDPKLALAPVTPEVARFV